jgi:broad specificity phosphatase PhoE
MLRFMKLLIARHGESEDDIIDAFGGWADFDLTQKGLDQAKNIAERIAALGEKFDIILSSPFKRANQTAKVVSEKLGVKIEVFEYIKERNTYGVMTGMVKAEAAKKYPWLMESFNKWEYVDGQERAEDILTRAGKAYEFIQKMGYSSAVLITHGNFTESFFTQNFNKKITKKEQAGFILIEANGNECKVLKTDGIEIE